MPGTGNDKSKGIVERLKGLLGSTLAYFVTDWVSSEAVQRRQETKQRVSTALSSGVKRVVGLTWRCYLALSIVYIIAVMLGWGPALERVLPDTEDPLVFLVLMLGLSLAFAILFVMVPPLARIRERGANRLARFARASSQAIGAFLTRTITKPLKRRLRPFIDNRFVSAGKRFAQNLVAYGERVGIKYLLNPLLPYLEPGIVQSPISSETLDDLPTIAYQDRALCEVNLARYDRMSNMLLVGDCLVFSAGLLLALAAATTLLGPLIGPFVGLLSLPILGCVLLGTAEPFGRGTRRWATISYEHQRKEQFPEADSEIRRREQGILDATGQRLLQKKKDLEAEVRRNQAKIDELKESWERLRAGHGTEHDLEVARGLEREEEDLRREALHERHKTRDFVLDKGFDVLMSVALTYVSLLAQGVPIPFASLLWSSLVIAVVVMVIWLLRFAGRRHMHSEEG